MILCMIARRPCRLMVLALAVSLPLLVLPRAALAQTPAQPTTIAVTAPASAQLGQRVTVQARLVGTAGPIAKARVEITIPTTFFNYDGEMMVASALTDAQGLVTAQFDARRSGEQTVSARFLGGGAYAPAQASAKLTVTGDRQLYVQEVLPSVPGINSAPVSGFATAGSTRWLLTGWPIAAVLILVWSAYAAAVFSMWRIAAASGTDATEELGAGR